MEGDDVKEYYLYSTAFYMPHFDLLKSYIFITQQLTTQTTAPSPHTYTLF